MLYHVKVNPLFKFGLALTLRIKQAMVSTEGKHKQFLWHEMETN